MNGDEEPEVQHVDECEHPIGPCTCPRDHLLDEGRRIREMCLFAEGEFARENQRAVDLKIDRDRLQKAADTLTETVTRDLHVLHRIATAVGQSENLSEAVHAVVVERDRLRVVVDAAREFEAADAAWHGKIERGEAVQSTDDESLRRAAAVAALLGLVRQLDASEGTGG
jgi:hypothetical protein